MCACADAEIFAVAPIGEVVRAFLTCAGMVGGFVCGQVVGFADVLGEFIKIGGNVVGRNLHFAVIKICGWLDGELVERDVPAREFECVLQTFLPAAHGLGGECIDEVKRVAREGFGGEFDGVTGFIGGMFAAEELEFRRVKALHADGNAVDSRRAECAEFFGLHGCWVGLERDFAIIRQAPEGADFGDYGFN